MKVAGRNFARGTVGESKVGRIILADLRHAQAYHGSSFMSQDVYGRPITNYKTYWTPSGYRWLGSGYYMLAGNWSGLQYDLTIELQVNITAYIYHQALIQKHYYGEFDIHHYDADGRCRYEAGYGSPTIYSSKQSRLGLVTVGRMFHFALTRTKYSATQNRIHWYNNGDLNKTEDYGCIHEWQSAQQLTFGARTNGTSSNLTGLINYVAISPFVDYPARILQRAISARKP